MKLRLNHIKLGLCAPSFHVELTGPGGKMTVYNSENAGMAWNFAKRLADTLGVKVLMRAGTAELIWMATSARAAYYGIDSLHPGPRLVMRVVEPR